MDTTAKRITPAGQGRDEEQWQRPDQETRDKWLSEARQVYHANKDRRAAEAWGKCRDAARVILLLETADEAEAEAARQRAENARLRERLLALRVGVVNALDYDVAVNGEVS